MISVKLSNTIKEFNSLLDEKDRIINELTNENVELKEELNYSKTHCLFHSDCPTQKELAGFKLKVEALEGQTPWKDIKDKSEVLGKLSKARELLKTFLLIADNKVSQMEFQLSVADAKQFLKESEVEE